MKPRLPSTHPARRRWLALLLAALCTIALAQSDEEKTRAQLQQLEKDIKRITWEVSHASSRRSKLQDQLREAEVELGTLKRDITATRADIERGNAELVQLQARQGELVAARDEQQSRVARELRSAWQIGGQGPLRVLLNQEDPQQVARAMGYYRYVFEARSTLIDDYRETLSELDTTQRRIDTTLETLAARREALEKQRRNVTSAQGNRELAVANLSAEIDSGEARLKELDANRKELEQLLLAIEEAVVDLQVPADYQAFTSAKGAMPWPVPGKHSNRFGRKRNTGDMRWQGVTIPAKEGTTVRAIHHGRVVYADWLRGSGLLLIIDHGDGYMSLYAHNQSLLRNVGEWVTAGTPISTVGNSGGQEQAALYFEIRHDGKPTDPSRWCRG